MYNYYLLYYYRSSILNCLLIFLNLTCEVYFSYEAYFTLRGTNNTSFVNNVTLVLFGVLAEVPVCKIPPMFQKCQQKSTSSVSSHQVGSINTHNIHVSYLEPPRITFLCKIPPLFQKFQQKSTSSVSSYQAGSIDTHNTHVPHSETPKIGFLRKIPPRFQTFKKNSC